LDPSADDRIRARRDPSLGNGDGEILTLGRQPQEDLGAWPIT